MKRSALDRLLKLRRLREERSLEALTLREGEHRRAKARAEDASDAVIRYVATAKEAEHELLSALLGENVKRTAMERFQANRDVMALRHADLRSQEEAAKKDLNERRKEVEKARKKYRQHYNDAEKLNDFVDRQKMKAARKQSAIDESVEEDQSGLNHRPGQLL